MLRFWITSAIVISVTAALPLNEVTQSQDQRIEGGHDAEMGAYPWQISVNVLSFMNYFHYCGGSIIDKQWILTAAHCIETKAVPPISYSILAGAHDLTRPNGHEQRIGVSKIIVHDEYNATGNHDVALIKIDGNFQFNEFVSPIQLARPEQEEYIEGNNRTYCVTSGWGNLNLNGSSPTILQAVEMPLLPLQICKDNYRNEDMHEVTDDMLCTGHMKGDKSPCHGDSGGPLACLIEDKWTLTGVVSWGKDCGYPEYPAVYARVTYFYDWIKKSMADNN